eukprot:Skav215048  [mRNA]  locus=scaffold2053:114182:120754:- [translate_table: standard]
MTLLKLCWCTALLVALADEACEVGKGYAKAAAKVTLSDIDDATACQFECGRDENCELFTYDTSSSQCYLFEDKEMELEEHRAAIGGPISCDMKLAYEKISAPVVESPKEREDRIMVTLKRLCRLVLDHGKGPEGTHRFIREHAEKVLTTNAAELHLLDWDDVAEAPGPGNPGSCASPGGG